MLGQTNQSIQAGKLQRRLRKTMTDAELKLWQSLRCRQLQDCKFRRQHPWGDFILDFACLNRMLVIELDGGQHAESTDDLRRDRILQDTGFTVLRFWNNDVLTNTEAVVDVINRALLERRNPSPPQPSP